MLPLRYLSLPTATRVDPFPPTSVQNFLIDLFLPHGRNRKHKKILAIQEFVIGYKNFIRLHLINHTQLARLSLSQMNTKFF